jgi:hypothetical protein
MRRIVTYVGGRRPAGRRRAAPAPAGTDVGRESPGAGHRTVGERLGLIEAPVVRLGTHLTGGLAPAILGIVDRGVRRRPGPARALRAEIELTIDEGYPPVRVRFDGFEVLVEDGPGEQPDARIRGALVDFISLMVSPAVGGVPLPVNARGRAALGMVVSRRVRIEGSVACVRRMLALIRV